MNEYRVYVRGCFHCRAETENAAMDIIYDNIPEHDFYYTVDRFTCNDENLPFVGKVDTDE